MANINLTNSYCIFMDILGFSEQIKIASNAGKGEQHLNSLIIAIENASKEIMEESILYNQKIFTDNIVIGSSIQHLPKGEEEGYFGILISMFIDYQLSMVKEGFFIRGAWTIGELYMNDIIVYGKALIDAHDLEKAAVYPKIVFSNNMKLLINRHLKFYAPDFGAPQQRDVLKDSDGSYFINYLEGVIYEEGIDFDSLKLHKKMIIERIKEFQKDEHILEKYIWSAQYHNFFCKEFLNKCPKELFIDGIEDREFNFLQN